MQQHHARAERPLTAEPSVAPGDTAPALRGGASSEAWSLRSVVARAQRALGSERLPSLLTLLALLLALPSVAFPLQVDDHLLLLNERTGAPWWSLYSASADDLAHARQIGALGWWSSSDLTVRFIRPLASLSHALEFAAFPHAPWAMHLVNVLLYAALVWLAVQLYRRLLAGTAVAGLAALMFAVDDGHSQSVGWIAGRNALFVCFFVLASLYAHVDARERSAPRPSLVSAACLVLALLFGEAGIAAVAYLLAYALTCEPGPLHRRLLTLLPHGVVLACWAAVYVLLGGGTHGMTLYRGGGSPLDTATQGLFDLPTWLLSLLGPSLVSTSLAVPEWPIRLVCLALLVPLVALVWPAIAQHPRARFFALGSLLCIVPLFATMPQDRLLLAASFGAFGLIACSFEVAREQQGSRARWSRRSFGVLHVALAPLFFLANLNGAGIVENGVQRVLARVPELGGREAVLVNSPTELLNPYALSAAHNAGLALPASFHQLYAGSADPIVTRVDARTLEMTVPGGWGGPPLASTVREQIKGVPTAGDVVDVANLRVHVLAAAENGMPERVRFEFPTALEASNRTWFAWRGTDLEPWTPPALGQSVTLEGIHPFAALIR